MQSFLRQPIFDKFLSFITYIKVADKLLVMNLIVDIYLTIACNFKLLQNNNYS